MPNLLICSTPEYYAVGICLKVQHRVARLYGQHIVEHDHYTYKTVDQSHNYIKNTIITVD